MKRIWIMLSIISLLLPAAYAFSGESSNYRLSATMGFGGGAGSSANYNIKYSMPESPVGKFSGTNYELCVGHSYTEPVKADIQVDCEVNILDLIKFGNAFGSTPSKPNWNSAADLKSDNIINVFDLSILGKNYGKSCWERCSD